MSETTANNSASWTEPSAAKIAEWKKEHEISTIHVLKVRDDRDGKIKKAYCRTPSMSDLIRASQSQKEKAGTYNQSLFVNCLLDCHPDIKTEQALYQGAVFAMDKIIVAADVEVEKL
jgi:hypothetical protein